MKNINNFNITTTIQRKEIMAGKADQHYNTCQFVSIIKDKSHNNCIDRHAYILGKFDNLANIFMYGYAHL